MCPGAAILSTHRAGQVCAEDRPRLQRHITLICVHGFPGVQVLPDKMDANPDRFLRVPGNPFALRADPVIPDLPLFVPWTGS